MYNAEPASLEDLHKYPPLSTYLHYTPTLTPLLTCSLPSPDPTPHSEDVCVAMCRQLCR